MSKLWHYQGRFLNEDDIWRSNFFCHTPYFC